METIKCKLTVFDTYLIYFISSSDEYLENCVDVNKIYVEFTLQVCSWLSNNLKSIVKILVYWTSDVFIYNITGRIQIILKVLIITTAAIAVLMAKLKLNCNYIIVTNRIIFEG